MASETRILLPLLFCICTGSLVLGDAPVSPQYYAVPTPSKAHYSAPNSPGSNYGSPPSSQYEDSSSGYQPGPAPYGAPPAANGYDQLRDFSTAPQSSFVTRRLFNTSVALTVPLFSFTLPQRASQGSTVDLANQAIFGLFSLLVVVLVFAVPILFTGSRPALTARSNDRSGVLNNLLSSNKVFNFMGADLSNTIGLDAQKCFMKTICEAHRSPKKYGLLAQPFLMFFPPPSNTTAAEAKASLFQLAAKEGKSKTADCDKKFKCFFDLLDLADYCIDWWKYTTNPQSVIEM